MARQKFLTWLQRVLLVVAALSLGVFAFNWLDATVYQWLQQRRLNDAIRGKTFGQVQGDKQEVVRAAATRREISRSGLIGRIEIPRLGVSAMVAEGTSTRVLRRAVGHLSETSLPGEPGNVALAGHRDSFFRRLSGVREGDRVRITTPDGVHEYSVESHRVVGPKDMGVLKSSSTPTLTLITCFPFNYIGAAPERFVVRARQIEPIGPKATGSVPDRRPSLDPGRSLREAPVTGGSTVEVDSPRRTLETAR
ncbi:MAG TPA: class D sortase [Candidatus Polarisedimenticolia bacterium]|nr:class D sortase [Candidatus Polarisedimenticolia bacterium]